MIGRDHYDQTKPKLVMRRGRWYCGSIFDGATPKAAWAFWAANRPRYRYA